VGPADAEAIARAATLAKQSDVVVLVLGTNGQVEAEGRDRRDLNLPGAQQQLLEAVFAANRRVALVLMNAGPLATAWAHDRVPAVMAAWFPGEEGGNAVARALLGVDNPGGKLPYTVYASLDGVPPQNEYDVSKGYTYMYFKGVPLYPFGHGLSYTRFRFSNLKLSASSIRANGQVEASFDVTNTGSRAGAEVAQLYTHQLKSRSYQPIRTLRAFQRVTLEPNETRRLTFTLPAAQLAWYQGGETGFAVEPGVFDIGVGASSDNIRLRAPLTVTAR
jgi:beta-glucosidase